MQVGGAGYDRSSGRGGDCLDALSGNRDQPKASDARQTHEQWRQENRQAMKRYNERVQEHGVFSDGVRCF